METRELEATFERLELPDEFADLEGLLEADLRAIVAMVATRAHERLFLTRNEHRLLQTRLWNRLADVVEEVVEPLRVEYR